MESKTAVTVLCPREELERLWRDSRYRPEYIETVNAIVSFTQAPGDRGTEIHVDLQHGAQGGKLGETVRNLLGALPLAKVKDDLRRFKQHVETGEIPRSDASPEGERAERKLKQRPAQPLREGELEKAGV
jgi:uncharacterized membrane protein